MLTGFANSSVLEFPSMPTGFRRKIILCKMKTLFLSIPLVFIMTSCERPPAVNSSMPDQAGIDHSKMNHAEMNSSSGAAAAAYELQFLNTMIAHH